MASSTSSFPTTTGGSITKEVQAASIFLVSAASGGSLAMSFLVVPRLLESPTLLMLRQFERTVIAGRNIFPGIDLVSSLGFFWLAMSSSSSSSRRSSMVCYGLAGLLSVGVIPYTWLVMMSTNRKLLRRAEQTRGLALTDEVVEPADEREGSKFLVDRWGVLNVGRSALVVTAGLLGLYASL